MVILGLAVGFRFHASPASILAGMALVLAFGYAFSWVYAAIGLATKDPETAQVAGILPFFILMFASSAIVPVATMPGWLQPFARNQPLSVVIAAVRALSRRRSGGSLGLAVAGLVCRHSRCLLCHRLLALPQRHFLTEAGRCRPVNGGKMLMSPPAAQCSSPRLPGRISSVLATRCYAALTQEGLVRQQARGKERGGTYGHPPRRDGSRAARAHPSPGSAHWRPTSWRSSGSVSGVTVRDVYETLRERRQIAYTTVMTVMNNLVKKELLAQDRSGIAYLYTPAIPGNEVASTILDSVVQRLFRGRANLALSHLLGLKRDLDPEQAEELRNYAEKHFVA